MARTLFLATMLLAGCAGSPPPEETLSCFTDAALTECIEFGPGFSEDTALGFCVDFLLLPGPCVIGRVGHCTAALDGAELTVSWYGDNRTVDEQVATCTALDGSYEAN